MNGEEYHFHFMAKGGGSANKTFLYQETKAGRLLRTSTRPTMHLLLLLLLLHLLVSVRAFRLNVVMLRYRFECLFSMTLVHGAAESGAHDEVPG